MAFLNRLGPGLLYAGAAIGVSHLVQSTRAGALYGVGLILAIVLIHLLKYGFFKAAAKYPQLHGSDLVHGYRQLSPIALTIFLLMTVLTAHIVIAAITLVSAGLLANLLGVSVPIWALAAMLLVLATCVLWFSNASRLSAWLKWVVLSLSLATILCVFLRASDIWNLVANASWGSFQWNRAKDFAFLVAFLGWMPAPMDITVWQSCWIAESQSQKQSPRQQNQDFNVGYWGTAVMAILFVLLGAVVFQGANTQLAEGAVGFTQQFLTMYAESLGSWSLPLVAFAALATMLSTLLTCLDAYPLSVVRSIQELRNQKTGNKKLRRLFLLFTATGAWIIVYFYGQSLRSLVDFVTTVSFILAPIIAFFNYRLVWHHAPWSTTKALSIAGLAVLSLLAVAVFFL